jgi:hypothetical protein
MPDSQTALPGTQKRTGVAADHEGFDLKEYLVGCCVRLTMKWSPLATAI